MRLPLIAPIHREGWPFIAGFAVATIGLALLNQTAGAVGVILTLWCAWFFRDPPRTTPLRPGLVIAPADGVVTSIEPAIPPAELGGDNTSRLRVSIFMNVFDVHVNRAPASATITRIAYHPGRFFNAAFDKASQENERQSLRFSLPDGRDLLVVQIAGLIARRIVGWVREGQEVQTGERFGMIRFGSRVDVYLPDGVEPLVCQGQKSIAGETVLADLGASEGAADGTFELMLRRRPSRRLQAQSFHRLIPNIVTLTALSAGLTAVRFSLEARWQAAIVAVVIAAVLDGLDGRIARLIGATSKFGAELDSLSDFVCFGVVPGLISYLWALQSASPIGWAAILIYAVGAALRLARFNTALEDDSRPPWTYNYFVGVPAPAAAGLALMPLIASLQFNLAEPLHPGLVGAWLISIAGLMVSRIPTYAFKRIRIPNLLVVPVLLLVAILAAGLATEPWLTLLGVGASYLISIPLSIRSAIRLRRLIQRPPDPPATP